MWLGTVVDGTAGETAFVEARLIRPPGDDKGDPVPDEQASADIASVGPAVDQQTLPTDDAVPEPADPPRRVSPYTEGL